MSSVAFYFDYRSSYSYLADSQVSTLGVPIEYRPVDLVVVLQLTNNPARTSASPAKFRYGNVDGLRWAKRYGIGFGLNDKISLDQFGAVVVWRNRRSAAWHVPKVSSGDIRRGLAR